MTSDAEAAIKEVASSLELKWVFGFNKDLVGGVINLSDDNRKAIFHVAGHVGVIYDFQKHKQTLLQGHCNEIKCVCASPDKRWIATADQGEGSMIVIWDSYKGIPIKTLFSRSATEEIIGMDMSHDSMYLITLTKEGPEQTLSLWDWTSDSDEPLHTTVIQIKDLQYCVRFHPSDSRLLVTNGKRRVIFWSWAEGAFKFFSPPISSRDFKHTVGAFTQSTFLPNTSMAATATVDGDIIVWEQSSAADGRVVKPTDKQALKVIRVHNSPIIFLTCVGKQIVTGSEDGVVRFYDFKLRIVAWFDQLDGGPITSISFERSMQFEYDMMALEGRYQGENEGFGLDDFNSPNFVVGTMHALAIYVQSDSFITNDLQLLRGDVMIQGQEASIRALAAHPYDNKLAISGLSGYIHLWDYEKRRIVLMSVLKNLAVFCMAYDPKGEYLTVGCTNGTVKVLDANTLEEIQSFRSARECITKIIFSHDSLYFAVSDADHCVGIYRYGHRDEDERKPIEWVYVGRFKTHSKPIVSLQFGIEAYGDIPRLVSVGEDRRLVEYDLKGSTITGGVQIKSLHKIEQSAVPTSLIWSTDSTIMSPNTEEEKNEWDMLLVANDQYKFKRLTLVAGSSTSSAGGSSAFNNSPSRTPSPSHNEQKTVCKCKKTLLGPTFGGPIAKMALVPNRKAYDSGFDNDQQSDQSRKRQSAPSKYLAYATHEKVIGLVKLPLDGNPSKSMGLIAHSGVISDMAISHDGKFLFTCGENDFTVNQWTINGRFLDKVAQQHNYNSATVDPDLAVCYELVEGGKDGEFMEEMRQYFYYSQIRSQGEDTTSPRQIRGLAPLDQVPDLMRALGFYPSQFEIDMMMQEAVVLLSKTDHPQEIDFDTLLKLYVNHRPVLATRKKDIERAFVTIGAEPVTGIINREYLFEMLRTRGEAMSYNEVDRCLKTMLGDDVTEDQLEDRFTASEFAENLLGFEDYEGVGQKQQQLADQGQTEEGEI